MGTVAIQTQCCVKTDDEWEDSDDGGAQEGTAVQLVDSVPWHGRSGGTRAGPPVSPPATNLSRSLSETSTIFFAPQQQQQQTPRRA